MPNYDYDCAACGRRSEIVHGVYADPPTECPLCGGGPLRKAVTAPAVHFKGSGWAKKERRATPAKAGSSTGSSDDGSSKGDTSSSDQKDGASSTSEPAGGSKGAKTGGDAGTSTATKPATD
jgi:putative FmdB family regulatory protein